jgi:hypothetical protein
MGSHGHASEVTSNAMTPVKLLLFRRMLISTMQAMAQAGSVIADLQSLTMAAPRSICPTMRISTDRETDGNATETSSGRKGAAF